MMKNSGFELPNENASPRVTRNQSSGNRSSGNHSSGNNTTLNTEKYAPTNTNSSLARVGQNLVHSDSASITPNQKAERRKEKQKILDKLE